MEEKIYNKKSIKQNSLLRLNLVVYTIREGIENNRLIIENIWFFFFKLFDKML